MKLVAEQGCSSPGARHTWARDEAARAGYACAVSLRTARAAFLVIAPVVALFAAAGQAQARSWVIQGDTVIGGYLVKKDGTLQGALERFGPPSRKLRDRASGWNGCDVTWRRLGLRIYFYNLGGRDPCVPQYGYFRNALMIGKRWRTANGLQVGDPMRSILQHHPAAERLATGAWWALVTRAFPYGDGGTYAGLAAKVNRGSVSAFSIYFQAGGE